MTETARREGGTDWSVLASNGRESETQEDGKWSDEEEEERK